MEDWGKKDITFRYMMLSRLKMDCDYYFGNGGQNPNVLWTQNEKAQIENMVALWRTFDKDDRPEWLTWGDIVYYALKMGVRFDTRPNYVMYFRKNREDDTVNEAKGDPYYTEPYIDHIYSVVKLETIDMDAIYGDYIKQLVGVFGLNALISHNLVEMCGTVHGRPLYVLCDK